VWLLATGAEAAADEERGGNAAQSHREFLVHTRPQCRLLLLNSEENLVTFTYMQAW
jgi:hypothetical protein